MPKKVYRIRKFEGGLNEYSDPKDLQEGQFASAQDVSFDKLGQARNIGVGTEDTDISRLDGNSITVGHGLHAYSSGYTFNPTTDIARPSVVVVAEANDGLKAYGRIQCLGGYLDTSIVLDGNPAFYVEWTTTTADHSAVEISDHVVGWFTAAYILNGADSGSVDCKKINELIDTKIDSETSTPNFVASLEGDQSWCKIQYNLVGPTNDYDSDGGTAENTAGVLSLDPQATATKVTLGSALTQEQISKISSSLHQETPLDNLDDNYILVEIKPDPQHGDDGDPGWLLFNKQDVSGGTIAVAHVCRLDIGEANGDKTWISGTTTTYSFTIHDMLSTNSQTTSFTTTGTSYDTAQEVAAKLHADYSTFENISSSVSNYQVTFTQSATGHTNIFTITTEVVHNRNYEATGENYLAYVSPSRILNVFSYDKGNNGDQKAWHTQGTVTWTDGGLGTGWATDTPKPHMYAADGELRIVDKDFSSNLINAWYGHVGVGSCWATNSAFGGWKTYPQSIKIPTGKIRTDGGTAVGTPSADQVRIYIVKGANDTGHWNGKYKFHVSAVFNDGQESLPDKTLTFSGNEITDFGDNPNCNITLDIAVTPDADEPFDNRRITGFSIYYTQQMDNYMVHHYLGTIDQTSGWIGADGQIAALSQSGSTAHITAVIIPSDVTTQNYEFRGFPSTLNTSIHAYNGTDGLQFKTSCIAKSRLIVGNLAYNGRVHTSEMCVTPWRKFDTFPIPYGILTVNNDDADAITHLEASGDRVLQFKENNLYIINVAEAGSEVVEFHHRYKGVTKSEHVCQTDKGIFWINKTGAFLFDGDELKIRDVFFPEEKTSGRRIGAPTWSAFFSDDSVIGYDAIRKQVVIKKSNKAVVTSGDIYLYDLNVDAWSFGKRRFSNNAPITNIVTTTSGNMTALRQGDTGDNLLNGGEVPI